jgi:hypothetical protein
MGLIETTLTSPHLHALFNGLETHSSALRLVGQLVPFTSDEGVIKAIIRSALPASYRGNTLDEVPRMISDAVRKGFAEPRTDKGAKASVEGMRILSGVGTDVIVDEHGELFLGIRQKEGALIFHPLRSTLAKAFIRRSIFRETGKPLAKEALNEIIDTIEANALDNPERVKLHLRIGRMHDAMYLDPGWPDGRIIRITADGWSVETQSPVRFYRPPGFGEMPRPERGGSLTALHELLGLDDHNWTLLVAFLANALRPDGPYMFLLVEGEQGSGKSLLCTIVKRIIDPSAVEKLRVPKTEHDLMIQAGENHLIVFDNTSRIRWDMSDALCSLATGTGFSTRKYYTDNESRSFRHCRPVVMNGIGQYADKPDLLERSIQLQLPAMPREGRKTEREIMAALDAILPQIFGGLLDAMAYSLKHLADTPVPRSIRMADAAHWLCAAEPAFGFPKGTIVRAIKDVQEDMMADRVINDLLVLAIVQVAGSKVSGKRSGFTGTIAELLVAIREKYPNEREIPPTPAHLSNALRRLNPGFQAIGVTVTFEKRTRKGQVVTVEVDETVEIPPLTRGQKMASKIG